MKTNQSFLTLCIKAFLLIFIFGCSKNTANNTTTSLPTLTTVAATSITQTSATSGGNITNDGGSSISQRGICWSLNANPTTTDSKTTEGSGSGSFSSNLTGLALGTAYHVRAYAINSKGTAYGQDLSFTTNAAGLPVINTTTASQIIDTSVLTGGNIVSDGGAAVTARGVCWSTSPNPTIYLPTKTSNGAGIGNFSSTITTLNPATWYYIRAYATNVAGTSYGGLDSFHTIKKPNVATTSVNNVTSNSATCEGGVVDDYGSSVTAKGICWSATNVNPTISDNKTNAGTGIGAISSVLIGLSVEAPIKLTTSGRGKLTTCFAGEDLVVQVCQC